MTVRSGFRELLFQFLANDPNVAGIWDIVMGGGINISLFKCYQAPQAHTYNGNNWSKLAILLCSPSNGTDISHPVHAPLPCIGSVMHLLSVQMIQRGAECKN